MKNIKLCGLLLPIILNSPIVHSEVKVLNYTGFKVWLDCSKHGPYKFTYDPRPDTGNLVRVDKFTLDNKVPRYCQQTSSSTYGKGYDRGHMVPENHLDYSRQAMTEANNMTNVLPQAANMNRGAWLVTEEITECYRDFSKLTVIGGTIWGNNTSDDYFLSSHNITTPDAYWKIIINNTTKQSISWIVPNSQEATRKNIDKYLVSISDIENITGEKLTLPNVNKTTKLTTSWTIPKTCKKN